MKKKQWAISVLKTYDNVDMAPELILGDEQYIYNKLKELQEFPQRAAYTFKQNDHLTAIPHIEFTICDEDKEDCHLAGIVKLTHTTHLPDRYPMNPVWKAVMIISIWSLIGLGILLYIATLEAQKEQEEMRCYMHFYNGVPRQMVIYNQPYKMNPNGTVNELEEVFMTQELRDEISKMEIDDCIAVNH